MKTESSYTGILFIGDPHLASRNPGFRRDEYPQAILGKLQWCMEHASRYQLLPVLLGDLFHWPRDNANWMLTDVINLFKQGEVLSIIGNHDTTERDLRPDDSLSVIHAAGAIKLLEKSGSWRGRIGGVPVQIGGTSWSSEIPSQVERQNDEFVIWLTHHNVGFAGAEENWLKPREIPGVDIVVNGHIHRPLPDIEKGATTWINPGNIARVQRADSVREARPTALEFHVQSGRRWTIRRVEVPHGSFDDVFFEMPEIAAANGEGSNFIKGLESLQSFRTAGGAGLLEFLDQNLGQFEPAVQDVIKSLAQEVCQDG
jgi:predicted phosphodiesterase